MTPIEMADWIRATDFYENINNHFINDAMDEVESMLRQQEYRNTAQCDRIAILEAQNKQKAERIAELEKELNHMRSFFGCDPAYYGMTSAEPICFISEYTLKHCSRGNLTGDVRATAKPTTNCMIPLYTTPHHASDVKQTKPLSDDEIDDIWLVFLLAMMSLICTSLLRQ